MDMPMIAQRAFNTPLLVAPAKAAAFVAGLGPRLMDGQVVLRGAVPSAEGLEAAGSLEPRAGVLVGETGERYARAGRPLFSVRDGVAVIEVSGTLVHRGAWLGRTSGVTSYEGLAAQIAAAADDPLVRGIALEVDSFGGEVAGAFDLADAVRAAREKKPVQAFVAEAALSAGYILASQADRVIVPRTGAVGSIGVVVMHTDLSEALAAEGVVVTLVHAGARKVEGNPYEPLPPSVRADWQAELEGLRVLFAETVAAGRGGRLGVEAALATQAGVYRGAAAVEAGLADEVADLRTAFAGFVAGVNRRGVEGGFGPVARGSERESSMLKGQKPGADARADEAAPVAAPESQAAPAEATPEAAPAPVDAPAAAPAEGAAVARSQAAEVARICAQAGRLGLSVDAAAKIEAGTSPEALRAEILDGLAAQADRAGVQAVAPPARTNAGQPAGAAPSGESPLLAHVRSTVEAGRPRH